MSNALPYHPTKEQVELAFESAMTTKANAGAENGKYTSLHHAMALATAVEAEVTLVYPDKNGPLRTLLNTTVHPLAAANSDLSSVSGKIPKLYMMWTNLSSTEASQHNWSPNHFVPLLLNDAVKTLSSEKRQNPSLFTKQFTTKRTTPGGASKQTSGSSTRVFTFL